MSKSRFGGPSDYEYEMREAQEYQKHLRDVENASLIDRKEACTNFFDDMCRYPDMIGERVSWLVSGEYGWGAMKAAKRIIKSPRMNRVAALTQIVAALDWACPRKMAISAWKKLTTAQKSALENEVCKGAGISPKGRYH